MIKGYGPIAEYIARRLVERHGFTRPLDFTEGMVRKWSEEQADPLPVVAFAGANYFREADIDAWVDRSVGRKQMRGARKSAPTPQLALLQ